MLPKIEDAAQWGMRIPRDAGHRGHARGEGGDCGDEEDEEAGEHFCCVCGRKIDDRGRDLHKMVGADS